MVRKTERERVVQRGTAAVNAGSILNRDKGERQYCIWQYWVSRERERERERGTEALTGTIALCIVN